jgi:Domain of unknown function (DUF4412)
MKVSAAAFAALLMLAGTGVARAGVVVDEQQSVDQGNGKPVSQNITVMVQGNKQRTSIGQDAMILDLDQGTRTIVNSERKIYIQMPFPPNMPNQTAMPPVTFKKTGGHQKIAGYSCDEYTGVTKNGGNESTIHGCFSSSAPGASEFATFNRAMAQKVKGTPMALNGEVPEGVPLKIDSTTKITHFSMPGMTPEQAAKVAEMLKNRPPTLTRMTATKVAEKDLSADTFAPPSGYTKQEPGAMMGKPGPSNAPAAGSGAAPTKVPE